jgi:glycine betaine/choline ABC-type transport system substrate-binding protein
MIRFEQVSNVMGMNGRQRLWRVELQLALPFIMSGIRTATVLVIGTTTLAALVVAGGLGKLILLGIDRNNHDLIILGAVPVALLAIAFDYVLRFAEAIDIYPEFTGTIVSTFLKEKAASTNSSDVYEQARAGILLSNNMVLLHPMKEAGLLP